MTSFWVAVLLLAVATLGIAQNGERRAPSRENEPLKNDVESRDRRGFVITPLSALPPSAVAPILSYLRAITEAASAQDQKETLPGVLAATAPLAADRAQTPVVVQATPVAKVVPAPPTVPSPAPPVLTAPLLPTPTLAKIVLSYSPLSSSLALGAAPLPVAPVVPGARLTALGGALSYSYSNSYPSNFFGYPYGLASGNLISHTG